MGGNVGRFMAWRTNICGARNVAGKRRVLNLLTRLHVVPRGCMVSVHQGATPGRRKMWLEVAVAVVLEESSITTKTSEVKFRQLAAFFFQ